MTGEMKVKYDELLKYKHTSTEDFREAVTLIEAYLEDCGPAAFVIRVEYDNTTYLTVV